MSDAMAEQKAADEAKLTAEQKTAQEAQSKRLWGVMIMLDPETGDFMIQPNPNVDKAWKLDALINQAYEQRMLAREAAATVSAIARAQQPAPKKGLFGGK